MTSKWLCSVLACLPLRKTFVLIENAKDPHTHKAHALPLSFALSHKAPDHWTPQSGISRPPPPPNGKTAEASAILRPDKPRPVTCSANCAALCDCYRTPCFYPSKFLMLLRAMTGVLPPQLERKGTRAMPGVEGWGGKGSEGCPARIDRAWHGLQAADGRTELDGF